MTDKKSFLEEIKKEIVHDLKEGKNNKKGLNLGSITVTVALAGLLIFSVAQTVQSNTIYNKVNSGLFKAGSPAGNSVLPSNLENLPNMVGGC